VSNLRLRLDGLIVARDKTMAEKQILGAGLDGVQPRNAVGDLRSGRRKAALSGCAAVPSKGLVQGANRRSEGGYGVDSGGVAGSGRSDRRIRGIPPWRDGRTHRSRANAAACWSWNYVREIEQRDVSRVVERASRVQLQEDRMLLQLFPQDFVVDEHPGHRDPRKMMASRLEVNVHLVDRVRAGARGADRGREPGAPDVEETVFEALAACYAAVLPEERRQGIAAVDIRGRVHGDGGVLRRLAVPGLHGPRLRKPFTSGPGAGVDPDSDEAETVKLEYGGALAETCLENVLVELPTPGSRERRDASRRVNQPHSGGARQELFRHVRSELTRVGMERSLLGGVFLTGGGGQAGRDLCDVAERGSAVPGALRADRRIEDWPDELHDPKWCVARGWPCIRRSSRPRSGSGGNGGVAGEDSEVRSGQASGLPA